MLLDSLPLLQIIFLFVMLPKFHLPFLYHPIIFTCLSHRNLHFITQTTVGLNNTVFFKHFIPFFLLTAYFWPYISSKQICLQIFEIIFRLEFSGLWHYILRYMYIHVLEACAACFTADGNKVGIVVNNLYGGSRIGLWRAWGWTRVRDEEEYTELCLILMVLTEVCNWPLFWVKWGENWSLY